MFVDLEFISVHKSLTGLWNLLRSPRKTLLLVKPQFEAGKGQVGKNGIVREPKIRAEAIANVLTTAQGLGWQFQGLTPFPIQGRTGNYEYWLWLSDQASEIATPSFDQILEITT